MKLIEFESKMNERDLMYVQELKELAFDFMPAKATIEWLPGYRQIIKVDYTNRLKNRDIWYIEKSLN